MSIRNAKTYKIAAITAFCFFSFSTLAQALTFSDIYQAQTQGQVLGASTPALVASTSSNATNPTTSPINTTGATLIVIGVSTYGVYPNISDTGNNTWHMLSQTINSNFGDAYIYYAYNPNTSASHTFNVSNGSGLTVEAFSGTLTTGDPADVQSGANGGVSASSFSTGNITPSQNGELIVSYLGAGTMTAGIAVDSGLNLTSSITGATSYAAGMAYSVQPSSAAINPNWSWTSGDTPYYAGTVTAFKAGSGSSPGAPTITSFTASPTSITSGQSSNLSWSTSGATSASISSVGSVSVSGSSNVNPTVTTTYTLTATNSSGSATANATVTVTGGGSDTIPPNLSAISSSGLTSSSASITWTTDENSDSQVDYGLTNSYGSSSALNSSLTTSHNTSLSSLSASTLYHYRVKSKDSSGNLAVSADQSFTTSASSGGGGGTWTQITPAQGAVWPFNPGWHKLVYDPVQQRSLFYTANNANTIYSDVINDYNSGSHTWGLEFDDGVAGVNCLDTATYPASRHPYWQTAYDSTRGRLYQYGGTAGGAGCGPPYSDTWYFSSAGHTWTQVFPATNPGFRAESSMVYDPIDDVFILYGGLCDSGSPTCHGYDTWQYSPATNVWQQVATAGPGNLAGYGMVYDSVNHKVILFGGYQFYNQTSPPGLTWIYDVPSRTWTQSNSVVLPPGTYYPDMDFDSILGQTVVYTAGGVWTYNAATDQWQNRGVAGGPSIPYAQSATMSYDPSTNTHVFVNYGPEVWELKLSAGGGNTGDATAPSTPSGLTASAISTLQINISWTASTDNVGVTGYKIYRGGVQVGTSSTNSYSDTGLTASTAYTYTVSAYDAAGNNSSQSAGASATTQTASSSGGAHIGIGCTTVFHIDKDCDGYGVGRLSADPNPLLGPDADDNDATVNTPASMLAKYGTLDAFLTHLGYSHSRIFYISTTGNDSTGKPNDPTHPYECMNSLASTYHDNQGGVFIFRAGLYNQVPNSDCDGYPLYQPTSADPNNPMIIMAYPGENVESNLGFGWDTNYWPGLDGANMIIDGFTFNNKTNTGNGSGIDFKDFDNVTMRNLEIIGFDKGIFIENHSRNITVENSVFHGNWSHSIYLGGEIVNQFPGDFDFAKDAVNYANHTSPGADENITIRHNLFYDDGNGGYEPLHINSTARNVNIDGNVIRNNGGTGIGFQSGIYNSTIQNNLIFNNGTCGITFFLYNGDNQANTIRWNTITNNTIWTGLPSDNIHNANPGCGILLNDGSSSTNGTHWIKDTTITNNIIVTDSYDPQYGNTPFNFLRDSFPSTDIIKNNLIYNNNPSGDNSSFTMNIDPLAYPDGHDAGVYNWAQFQAYSPNFSGNIHANPQFTSTSLTNVSAPGSYDFYPQSSSPAINAGLVLGASTTDLKGATRDSQPDIGAYEFNGTVTPGVPIISSFTSSPSTITSGGSSTLSWSVSGATSLSIDQSIGTVTGNSKSVSPTLTTTYTLTATNSSGSVTQTTTVTVSVPQPPVISSLVGSSITATTTTISWITDHSADTQVDYGLTNSYGQSSTLTDTSPLATNHTVTLSNLSPSTLYHFRAKSKDSNNLQTTTGDFTFTTLSLPLPPAPSISSFTPNPSSITLGQSSLLSFTVTGSTTSLSLNQGIGSVLGQNSKSVSPIVSTTYTLTAQGPGGTATAQVTVTVGTTTGPTTTAPTILSFTINPSSIILGQTVTLNFQATGTPTPTLSIDNSIGTVLGLTKTITPSTTTTYTLTAVNSAGTATAQATVNVTAAPTGGGGSGGSSGGTSGGAGGSGTTNTTVPTVNPDGSITFIPKAITPTSTPSSALRLINSNGTFYLIKNNLRYGITSPGILYSYGFEFKDAKTATQQDLNLPLGTLLLPGNGYLVKSAKDKTVYLISNNQRYAFTSAVVFTSLGFNFTHVFLVTDPELQSLPQAQNISDPNSKHLPGLDINRNGTIYWVGTDNLLHGYPNLSVYNSWHRDNDFSQVVTANAADLSLPVGGLVVERIVN